MTNQTTFRNLRYVLATIYDDDITARRVVQDAGLDPLRIAFSARAIDNWQAILSEAHKTARLNALLEVALTEYANNQPLRDAYDNYRRAADQPDPLDPIVEASLAEDAPAPGEPPFKGLTYFGVDDASIFFGREQQVDQLVNHLRQARFLAVVGASGSGKSSLVRAGLVPAIQGGAYLASGESLPAGHVPWRVHLITPTNDPLEALADALTRDNPSVTLMDTIMADMVKQPRSLHRHVKRWLDEQQPASDGCLIMVDQFEELFTMCRDQARRQHFVDNLMTAVTTDGPTRVVLTLRADFYAHCAQFNDLREALAKNQIYIGPMTTDELRRAITEPAHQQGWTFEPGLVDLLLTDVGHEPGALPLLSHALLETWRRRRGHMLTLAGYVGSGRVQGAIAQTAERVFTKSLTTAEQPIAKNIFLRLTELGEGTEDTRRRIKSAEIITAADNKPLVEHVLKTLADTRLITTHEDEVEVAHEALIREWPTLRQWLDEDRAALQIHRRLTEATGEWIQNKRDGSFLYRDALLSTATQWAERHTASLNDQEKEFLGASQAAQRRRKLLQWGSITTILALLIFLPAIYMSSRAQVVQQQAQATQAAFAAAQRSTATAIAQSQIQATVVAQATATEVTQVKEHATEEAGLRQTAERQSKIALARQLTAQTISSIERNQDAELSLLLALEAVRVTLDAGIPVQNADDALRQALASAPLLILRHDGSIGDIAFNADGKRLATASSDHTARIWDSESGHELIRVEHDNHVNRVAFSPDSKRFATASLDHTARIWDSNSGKELVRFQHEDDVQDIVFSANGKRLATASSDNTARMWDSESGQELFSIEHGDDVIRVVFSPNSKLWATASADGTARISDSESGQELARLQHNERVWDVTFSPDGHRLATASKDGTGRIWNSNTGEELAILQHRGAVLDIIFNIGGSRIATDDQGGIVHIWDGETGEELTSLNYTGDAWNIAFSPDGTRIATGDLEGTARIWDTDTGKELALFRHTKQKMVRDVLFDPTGARLATASDDGTARIWNIKRNMELIALQHKGIVERLIFSSDGKRLATTSWDHTARIWDTESGQELVRIEHNDNVQRVAFSPDNTLLATVSADNTAHLWDSASGKELAHFQHEGNVWDVVFSPDGKRLASSSADGTACILDVVTGKQLLRLRHINNVWNIAFSPDSKQLATSSSDNTVRIWNSDTGEEIVRLQHEDIVWDVVFSPDGKYLATASADSTARIWESKSGVELAILHHESNNRVWDVVFSSDGKRLASASEDGTARIWDSNSGEELALLKHEDWVNNVVFSADGKRVATASSDGTIHIWDSKNGEELTLFKHENSAWSVAFSPDGKRLASASSDGTARFWQTNLSELFLTACHLLSRDLTRQEWNVYFADTNIPYRSTCQNTPAFAY